MAANCGASRLYPKKLDLASIRDHLRYDRETGNFYWLIASGHRKLGAPAGGVRNEYIQIGFQARRFLAHRLAWLFEHGEMPESDIDHINGIKTDNRISNLRLATHQQNQWNSGACSGNKLGVRGVRRMRCKNKDYYRFEARIRVNKRSLYLGNFKTIDEASAAYQSAEQKYRGEFAFSRRPS